VRKEPFFRNAQKMVLQKNESFFPQNFYDFFFLLEEKKANLEKNFPKTFNREARQIHHQLPHPHHHHQSHLVQRFPRCIRQHR